MDRHINFQSGTPLPFFLCEVYEKQTSAVYGYFSQKNDVVVSFIPKKGQKDVPKALDELDAKLKKKGLIAEETS